MVYLVVASEGTVMVVALAYVHPSVTATQPSHTEAFAPKSMLLVASLEPAIAALLDMFELSMLPFMTVWIVLNGVLTSAASAVVPSEGNVSDMVPIVVLHQAATVL